MDFQRLVVSRQDLTSNCHEANKFDFEIIVPTTRSQYENNKLSKISPTTFLFDFGFRIQNEKVRLAWQMRWTWHSPFKILRFVWYVNDLTGDVRCIMTCWKIVEFFNDPNIPHTTLHVLGDTHGHVQFQVISINIPKDNCALSTSH